MNVNKPSSRVFSVLNVRYLVFVELLLNWLTEDVPVNPVVANHPPPDKSNNTYFLIKRSRLPLVSSCLAPVLSVLVLVIFT